MRTRMFRDSEVVILAREAELELAQAAQAGDTKAANTLVSSVMPFTLTMATRFCEGYRDMTVPDLFQDAMVLILEKAVPKFEPTKGRFITYAAQWAFKAFMDGTRLDSLIVRVPEKWFRVRAKRQSLPCPWDQAFFEAVLAGGDRNNMAMVKLTERLTDTHPIDLWAMNDRQEFVRQLHAQEQLLFLSRYAGIPLKQAAEGAGLSYHCARARVLKTRRMAKAFA